MDDLFLVTTGTGTERRSLPDGLSVHIRRGVVESWSYPDHHGQAERAAKRCAERRFGNRIAQRTYCNLLYKAARDAVSEFDWSADYRADVAEVVAGMRLDAERRARMEAAVQAVRAELAATATAA